MMRNKTKGFTLLELIITLSLTVMVLGVVYTFFFSSSKTLTTTEINSDLQSESEVIQKELLFYGTQAEKIIKIIDYNDINFISKGYDSLSDTNGKLAVTEIKFKVESDYFTFLYDINKNTLTLKKVDERDTEVTNTSSEFPKVLSSNVKEFKIRPLDYRMNPSGKFKDTTGLEILLVLNKKKGYSDVTIPLSVIVKFRNE